MPESRSPRRRPKAKAPRPAPVRQTSRWPLLFAALSLVVVASLTYTALRSPWLTVQRVDVKGVETLDRDSLAQISGLEGRSMLRLPLNSAREALLEIPQVKSVSFHRDWPQRVTLQVKERVPVAFWSAGGRDYGVDAEGVVLGPGAPSGPAPRIVEPDLNRILGPGDRVQPDAIALAVRVFKESPRFLGQSVDRLEYSPAIGVTAVFTNGLRVTFGDERAYDYKVAVLSTLLDKLSAQKVAPHAVDLRFGERVTYE